MAISKQTTALLTKDEESVDKLQNIERAFSQLPAVDVTRKMKQVLFNIHVITGWNMPADEDHLKSLYNQFEKKLLEDYGSLNTQEIEYAFRSGGTTIKDWGKVFNLSMLDEVLIPYLHRRAAVREITEKRRKEYPALPSTKGDWKELCEHYYQQFLSGTYNMALWPWQMYDEFVESGMMEAEFYQNAMPTAERTLYGRYSARMAEANLSGDKASAWEYAAKIEALIGEEKVEAVYLAKKLSVRYLYKQAQKQKIEHLFVKTEE